MSGTTTLTKQQKKFVDQFLRHGIFKSKAAKQENEDTKASYAAFLKAQAALDAELAGVPAPHADAAQASRAAAQGDHDAGHFADALATIVAARQALAEIKAALARHARLKAEATGFALPAWGKGPHNVALTAEIDKAKAALATTVPLVPKALDDAEAALDTARTLRAAGEKAHQRREGLLAEAKRLTGPAGADAKDKASMTVRRDAVAAALPNDPPAPAELEAAERALDILRRVVDRVGGLAALATARPAAAVAAKGAFTAFGKVLDDAAIADVTPDILADTTAKSAAARVTYKSSQAAFGVAKTEAAVTGLPGPEKQKRLDAYDAARAALNKARAEMETLEAIRQAAFGQDALSRAISHGPLSAETGRPFSDATADSLLKAFKDDPEVADGAAKAAAQAAHPDEVGARVGWAVQQVKSGFKAGGDAFNASYSRTYAKTLLTACGDHGPEYAAGLDAYVASGGQFKDDPIPLQRQRIGLMAYTILEFSM